MKCWLPPNTRKTSIEGSLLLRQGFTLVAVPDEGAVMISLPALEGLEERSVKLHVRHGA